MGKKCCKSNPPCKDCPKLKKKKKKSKAEATGCATACPGQPGKTAKFETPYFVPLTAISINGQRGCTAN